MSRSFAESLWGKQNDSEPEYPAALVAAAARGRPAGCLQWRRCRRRGREYGRSQHRRRQPTILTRALAKLPDWNGAWEPMRFARPAAPAGAPPAPPKLTPEYAKQYEAFQEKNRKTPGLNFVTNVANCVPAGLPGSMSQPYPLEFLFTPGRVTIIIETYSVVRRDLHRSSSLAAGRAGSELSGHARRDTGKATRWSSRRRGSCRRPARSRASSATAIS